MTFTTSKRPVILIRLYFLSWLLLLVALSGLWFGVNWLFTPTVSYWLGWSGFGIMCLTNLYVLRKKIPAMQHLGKPSRWLDFHIFCGLVGPTLVVFHTHFKVSGLVAISFWSMVISFVSGVVGRYFYTQLLQARGALKAQLKQIDAAFAAARTQQPDIYSAKNLGVMKADAIRLACGGYDMAAKNASLGLIIMFSVVGDVRLRLSPLSTAPGVSAAVKRELKLYGLTLRKILLLDAYKRLMGYWHTFHVPFAVFMYVVAVIHIVSALFFRVG